MSVRKTFDGNISADISNGTYDIAYRQDNGAWVQLSPLTVIIPSGRKAVVTIGLNGVETDA